MYAKARRYQEGWHFAGTVRSGMVQVQGCGRKGAAGGKTKPSVGVAWHWASMPGGGVQPPS